jgi:hypothetical protein
MIDPVEERMSKMAASAAATLSAAKDRITALENENAELKLYAGEKSNQYVAAVKKNKQLREALEPFAKLAINYTSFGPSDAVWAKGCVYVSDLRRALLALPERNGR